MNTIIEKLASISYDFCFKVDDDITFLKPGWDKLYYNAAKETGYQHLVYMESKWCTEQHLKKSVKKGPLTSSIGLENAQGIFYTLTPEVIEKVGYFDYPNFGFRGMGHVDFTARCCKAGFNDPKHPFDIAESNTYISAFKEDYSGALKLNWVHAYDEHFRLKKTELIQDQLRIHVPLPKINENAFIKFKEEVMNAMDKKIGTAAQEKKEIIDWYTNEYKHLPRWYLRLGKIFKLLR